MIDTVKVKVTSALDTNRTNEILCNQTQIWTTTYKGHVNSHLQEHDTTYRAFHKETGLRAQIKGGHLAWVEGSLPRLVCGSNGIQLKGEHDLHRVRAALHTTLQTLYPRTRFSDWKLQRLDLVLNLHVFPRILLALHRNARHPMIRRETECWNNQPPGKNSGKPPHQHDTLNTVRLHGVNTTISLYDKVREVLSKKRLDWPAEISCTRVEIQLRGAKHIAKVLGYTDRPWVTLDELNYSQCYRAYRSILLRFDPVAAIPAFKPNLASCLAVMERHPETWRSIGGVKPLDWYRVGKDVTDKQYRVTRNTVRKHEMQLHQFRWADLLPPDRLPAIVDVDSDGNETLIQSPCSFQ